ncbi:synaptobrevin homolog YKT6-like [Zootermopsis nevadensis]|uniref:Synaptobrevin-like protein YKT6 n=1 Tax=Zootermopsis nevadensis TaxID=136037 RepID=A0A067R4B2_ZOONE|nr:synaptobrevin homolog YKT6-like [Zootermopsis nevadensis]XP_021922871.1 synaptobrevin homolog YKT6-like [Zootermopsis nevadensis]XP_021922881.1 synaptobrevin homolog YKT6-like [Zootermopsis nevadensis]XP_021922882.1 synaptobrevin homolog YKT6-like [Zootermopsis nevadensis]KDR17908.1 Synaptobrevin-like protein YKT6 [Zootermopsis nevadensis]KDR17910.1 Synaptobrevin-like protein YKT6 [Zootermopsis nevadensis]
MVKLYALSVLYKGTNNAIWLKSAYDLSAFGFFQRGSVQEFMAFVSKTIVERTQTAARQSVKEGEYMCHVYVRGDNLGGVLISDHDYPHRVSHTLITKVLDDFALSVPAALWPVGSEATISFPQLYTYLAKYQNPREADAMTKIQEELDETKIILHNTIEAVLERGEKLDDLVAKSEGLSMQSKAFYKTARKTNSCCTFG